MSTDTIHLLGIAVQTIIFLAGIFGIVVRTDVVNKLLREEMKAMGEELKKLTTVITLQAVQTQRLDEQARRMTSIETRIEDLRHGRGYAQDRRNVDGEYP